MIDQNHFSLSRIPPFDAWRKRKFLVLHMQTPYLDVESCLKLASIPFKTVAYDEIENEDAINTDLSNCFGVIVTGSWLGKKLSPIKPEIPKAILNSTLPKLGLCFGYEEFGKFLGGNIIDCNPPFGEKSEVKIKLYPSILFEGLDTEKNYIVTMAHNYMLENLPPGCDLIAETNLTPIAGFQSSDKKTFGLQFHPEKGWMGDLVFRNFYKYCSEQVN